jgi:drug/metabolite transporter (DMT)-like permease
MVAVLCWLPMFSIAKRTLPYLDAFALGTARYAIGVLLLVLLLVAVEGRAALRYEGRATKATLSGLAGITGFNLFVWLGLAYTRPEHASIIMALQTPLTALAVWALRGQRPPAFTLACVGAAICGVLLVVTKGDPARAVAEVAEGGALFGDLLVLFAAISWVAYTLSSAGFAGWSPLRFTVLTCIPGFAGLAAAHVIVVAVGYVTIPSAAAVGAVAWQILYFSVGTVVVGILAFNAGARWLGPLNSILMLNLIPLGVFGIEAALGATFTVIELVGAVIVIAALVLNNLYLRNAAVRQS